jgi:DNA-nicking Smr family endonuclease
MKPIRPRSRRRVLADEERRLWAKVTETVDPLDPGRRPPEPLDEPSDLPALAIPPQPPKDPEPPPPAVAGEPRIVRPTGPTRRIRIRLGEAAIHVKHRPTLEGLAPPVAAPPSLARIDDKTRRRLVRGAVPIDGRLDLHGMTQEAAHSALRHFLHRERAAGSRIVLVITGKGRGGPGETVWDRGVLRRAVPHWLSDTELRDLVIGFEEAHLAHGGAGAIYVRLRRPRSGRPAP